MRIIIISICFAICLMITPACAEIMTLNGNGWYGTKYVPPAFAIKDSIDSYQIDYQANGMRELLDTCNSNDLPCEIVADVKITPSDDLYKGIITNIQSINGLNISEIKSKNEDIKNNHTDNNKTDTTQNYIDCKEFILISSSRSNKGTYSKQYYYPKNMNLHKIIINDKFEVPILDNFNRYEVSMNSYKNKTPYYVKINKANIFHVLDIYKDYNKITILDEDGKGCILEYKAPY